MQLYFVRHGRAENREDWFQPDHLRPLTENGIKRMEKSALAMRNLGLRPAVVLTSPLVRAQQTAAIVAETLAVPLEETEALAPGFGLAALVEMIAAFPTAESLMLVGHEPDFSIAVEGLMNGGRVIVKKGSLIRVDLFALNPPRGELIWNIPPKMLVL